MGNLVRETFCHLLYTNIIILVDGSIVERGRRSVGTDGIYLYVTNSTGHSWISFIFQSGAGSDLSRPLLGVWYLYVILMPILNYFVLTKI